MATNPYSAQLAGFNANIGGARRGVVDLYRQRRRGREQTYNQLGALYGGAQRQSAASTKAGLANVAGGARAGYGLVQSNAYGMDPAQASQLQGVVQRGAAPFSTLIQGQGSAEQGRLAGFGRAATGEQQQLKASLPREQSAALSELEQGIVGAQSALAAQASDFGQQQSFLGRQQAFYNMAAQQAGLQAGQPALGPGQTSSAESWIIQHESSGDPNAQNPKSTALGLGQLLWANRVKYARVLGADPNTRDANTQLAMMRLYVRDRYGTAQAAMQFWQAHGWY